MFTLFSYFHSFPLFFSMKGEDIRLIPKTSAVKPAHCTQSLWCAAFGGCNSPHEEGFSPLATVCCLMWHQVNPRADQHCWLLTSHPQLMAEFPAAKKKILLLKNCSHSWGPDILITALTYTVTTYKLSLSLCSAYQEVSICSNNTICLSLATQCK